MGGDNKFKLWREDPSQAYKSGRRFKCIFSQSPSNHIPYASFDFKTVKHEVWLVLITHDGLLSLLEPSEPEALHSWRELDVIYPYGQHSRGTEPRFRLSFHHSERPCYNAVIAGLDPKALSLAVTATNLIKIYRAIKREEGNYQFFETLEISTNASLINDVSWAPGCIRPYDLIATACDDGLVRIYEVATPHDRDVSTWKENKSMLLGSDRTVGISAASRNAPSGIGAGLASASRVAAASHNAAGVITAKHDWKEIAALSPDDREPVWKVKWVHDGKFYC